MEIQSPLKAFKYWARKPIKIALAYLEKYTSDKYVLLDPFAGSGVFVFAGLLKGMKVIYNDVNPYALFLARNALRPVDPKLIQQTHNTVLARSIPIDITTKNGTILIPKGTTTKNAINWFYESTPNNPSKSPNSQCNPVVSVDYYIWDTEYLVEKAIGDEYAAKKAMEDDARYKIFLEIICNTDERPVSGQPTNVYIYSRRDITEKWKKAFDQNPSLWLTHSPRGRKQASSINMVSANLIRLKIAKRNQRIPILKKTAGGLHQSQLIPLTTDDHTKIKLIEQIREPFPQFIPNSPLVYYRDDQIINFWQYREFQTFVKESLSTIEQEEWAEKIPRFKHYFTKRNLIALSLLFWSIQQIEDLQLREQLYLLFIANLHMNAKFDRKGPMDGWATGYYASYDDFKENNVLIQLEKGWKIIQQIKKRQFSQFQSNKDLIFDETWSAQEFFEQLNDSKQKNILWLNKDARDINSIIPTESIDIIFTDPPYKGAGYSVQYYELSAYFIAWLMQDPDWYHSYGGLDWWKYEIIDNKKQAKTKIDYLKMLEGAFLSINKTLKEDGIWIITYHTPSKEIWDGLKQIFQKLSLSLPPLQKIKTSNIGTMSGGSFFVRRYGSIKDDAYIVLIKSEDTDNDQVSPHKELPLSKFLELLLSKIKQELIATGGIITWDLFSAHFPHIVITQGGPYGNLKNYKDLYNEITIDIGDGFSLLKKSEIDDSLYKEIYETLAPSILFKRRLISLGKSRKKIPQLELEKKILPLLNNLPDKSSEQQIIEEVFDFDPVIKEYIFKLN